MTVRGYSISLPTSQKVFPLRVHHIMFLSLCTDVLHPPLNLTLMAAPQGGLLVSWLPNPVNPEDILGYKLNWDLPSRVVQSALTSVPPSVKEYLITGVDLSLEYVIAVWAYTMQLGDGAPAMTKWIPKCK